jgi:Spy/CpxP family protein refolding chaperone
VKAWKVILPTVVIFGAGALAGGLFVNYRTAKPAPPKPPVPWISFQERFQARLTAKLDLAPDQTNRLHKIFTESNERMRILWGLIGPELEKERQEVHASILTVLNPEQRTKYEEMLKQPPYRGPKSDKGDRGERPERPDWPDGPRRPRGGTNQTNGFLPPPPH